MKYAVTAANGKFGQLAIKFLLEKIAPQDIIAIVRDPQKSQGKFGDGIEVRKGDYSDAASLTDALKGVEKLLFISSIPGQEVARIDQHKNVVNAAKENDVQFIAYTSFPHADTSSAPLADDHKNTEIYIRDSGIKHSFLRNNWYLENDIQAIKSSANGDDFIFSAGDGKVGWALEEEYAQAAVNVLLFEDVKDIYEFTGPMHTYAELGAAVKSVTGQDFAVQSLNDEEYKQALVMGGASEQLIDFLLFLNSLIRDGALEEESNDLSEVSGKPVLSLEEAVKKLLNQ